MVQWIKIAGLSAILAAGVVTAFGNTGQALPPLRARSSTTVCPPPATCPRFGLKLAYWRTHRLLPIITSPLEKETVGVLGPRLIALCHTSRPSA